MLNNEKNKVEKITLFDIMMVSNDLLLELTATLSVVAWNKTTRLCKTLLD